MTETDLAAEFAELCEKWGLAQDAGDSKKSNRLFARISKMVTVLRERPDHGAEILGDLTSHENEYVRLKSAIALIPLDEQRAKEVLQAVAVSGGSPPARISAEMTVDALRTSGSNHLRSL